MAKNYSDIYTAVYDKGNSMSFGNAMLRGNGVPLDITEVYDSYNSAVLYAAENPVAYEGQLIAVTENGDTTVYVITPKLQNTVEIDTAGDGITKEVPVYIKAVGSVPDADGKTIEVVDGVLKLVGLDGLDSTKTYQPVLVNGVIEWHEPSATTVEGLDTRLTAAEGKITTLEGTVGDAEGGLVKDLADAQAEIDQAQLDIDALKEHAEDYIAADETLHTTITSEIAKALQDAKDYADQNDADTVYDDTKVKDDIVANATAIAGVKETADKAASDIAAEVKAREDADTNLKSELETYVATEIGKQAHFSAKVVTSEDEMTDATTLYLMKTAETGDDMYEEWMLIDGKATKIGTTATDLSDYSTTAEVTSLINTAKADLQASIDAQGDVHDADVKTLTTSVEGVADDLAEFKTTVESTYETKANVATKVGELETSINDLTTQVGLKAVKADVDAAILAVTEAANAAQDTADSNTTEINKLKTADEDFETRIDALESTGAEKNVINSASAEFTISDDRELSVNAIDKSKITGLTADLQSLQDSKVDKKTSLVDGVETEWTLLSPENAKKLSALTTNTDTGNIEISGTVNADNVEGLSSYITGNRDQIAGLFSSANETKLAGISTGAQVNVIEKIKINGTELTVGADKSVNIPFATNNTIGVVLSSDAENKIAVGADGTMEVNSLNVNRLVQTDGDTLILNGGHA